MRRDKETAATAASIGRFQSTRLREARRDNKGAHQADGDGFNPRACVRRDITPIHPADQVAVFQSTRLREARLVSAPAMIDIASFQSTRLREARPACRLISLIGHDVSIHAPA